MQYAKAKSPSEVLDYVFDWSLELVSGEIISTSTVTVGAGITKDSDSNTDDSVTVWLSGGTAGNEYQVTSEIVTDSDRTHKKTIIVPVLND